MVGERVLVYIYALRVAYYNETVGARILHRISNGINVYEQTPVAGRAKRAN